MTTQIQRRRGTTAQHSTFTGAEAELTVDTTKDTVVVHDGSTVGGRPLLREDQSNLPTSAPTTGIYNASGSLAISTGGSGRLFVKSNGSIGVGTSDPNSTLHVAGSLTVNDRIFLQRASGSLNLAIASYWDGTTNPLSGTKGDIVAIGNAGGDGVAFVNANTERMRLTSTGLGVGTSSPSYLFHVQNASADTNTFVGQSGSVGLFTQWRYNATAASAYGEISTFAGSNNLYIQGQSGGGNTILNPVSGRVGIGTTSVGANLDLAGTTSRIRWDVNNAYTLQTHGNAAFSGFASSIQNAADYQFQISGSERARIDSSGRLLVGTSSAFSAGASAQYGKLQVVANSISASTQGIVAIGRGQAAGASIASGAAIGTLVFTDNTGGEFAQIACEADAATGTNDYPGRLVFSVTRDGQASPTEAARINSTGKLNLFTASNDNVLGIHAAAAAGTSLYAFYASYGATSTVNPGTQSFAVFTNGNVVNTNNSYGSISDIKLKENIVDATSQWSDIKALQVRNYNFKEGQTHTQIGLIAQEVELVSPGLVSESPDRDAEGNDLGTVTKSVNYSVLYMKAVKALQEAMERIETLEAKVAALGTP